MGTAEQHGWFEEATDSNVKPPLVDKLADHTCIEGNNEHPQDEEDTRTYPTQMKTEAQPRTGEQFEQTLVEAHVESPFPKSKGSDVNSSVENSLRSSLPANTTIASTVTA